MILKNALGGTTSLYLTIAFEVIGFVLCYIGSLTGRDRQCVKLWAGGGRDRMGRKS